MEAIAFFYGAFPMVGWIVVAKKTKRGPFSPADLLRFLDAGKLSNSAFIRPDDDSADWQEIKTVDWLTENPEVACARYCVDCDCRLVLSSATAEQQVRCPNCFGLGRPIDYLADDPPPVENVPAEPWGPFDAAVVAIAVLTVIAGAVGMIALFVNPSLAVLLGFISLVIAGGLFGFSFHHRAESARYRTHIKHVEGALHERTQRLINVERELQGFRRNLAAIRNDMINDTALEIQKRRHRIERELAAASEHRESADRIAAKYLEQAYEWWTGKLNVDNFQATKDRLQKAIDFCLKQGHAVPVEKQQEAFVELKAEYERVLRRDREREEQRRIREQIREEQRVERELRKKLEAAESEQRAIQRALNEKLREVDAEHSAEVAALREQLREAQERAERAKSQAQLTKAGHVYVISNVGAFGDDVYKVGLTRRLEPADRIKELGDASVPFPFDIHMMISSEDAPKLEFRLHQALHRHRVNRINFRKEFFRVDLDTIRSVVEQHHGIVEYVANAEAFEYRQSQEISEEDFDYLEKVAIASGVEDEDDDVDGIEE